MKKTVYFDNGATTFLNENFKKDIKKYIDLYGNPSSLHFIGFKASEEVEKTRLSVAEYLDVPCYKIMFTSGGTESINTALFSVLLNLKKTGKNQIIISNIEHKAVFKTCELLETLGIEVVVVPVESNGIISVSKVKEKITKETAMISIMWVNNEIGTIQPIKEIGELCEKNNIIFHVDAVAAIGNIPIDAKANKIDLLSFSGHKIGSLKGVGVLYCRDYENFIPLINGGGQNYNLRAGTENVLGIISLGYAIRDLIKFEDNYIRQKRTLQAYFVNQLCKIPNLKFTVDYSLDEKSCAIINFGIKGQLGESLAVWLGGKKICVSTGSACNMGEVEDSHVLKAVNVGEDYLQSTIRITLSHKNTLKEIDTFMKCLKEYLKY